jgi:hypothetical protein
VTPAATQAVRNLVISSRVKDWRRDPRVSVIFYNHPFEGQRAGFDVGGSKVYPDLVVGLKDGRWIVEEVETADSLRDGEPGKWQTFSGIRADEVHLLVPDRELKRAREVTGDFRGLSLCLYTAVGSVVLFQEN